MADLRRVGCIERGTFVDAGGLLKVELSGSSPGLASVEQLFSQGFSNAETCSIVFYTDTTTWAAYSGAVFTTGTPNYLDLLTATEEETGSSGAPTDGAIVVVYAITELNKSIVASEISDSTSAGQALITAADVAAQQTALSLVPGTDVLANIVEDTTPQFGANVDVNGYALVSVSNADIPIVPDGTGVLILGGTSGAKIRSSVSDGASAIALNLNTTNTLTGGSLFTATNNGSLRFQLGFDGVAKASASGGGSFRSIDTNTNNEVQFQATGAGNYPRAAFLIGDGNDVFNNAALWAAPRGTNQYPCSIEALTNSDTSTDSTKRIALKATATETAIISARGLQTSGDVPLKIYPAGSSGAAAMEFDSGLSFVSCDTVFRVKKNASNYATLTVATNGTLTIQATGTAANIVVNGANRGAYVANVSTGTDATYESAINAILAILKSHGLMATS